MESITATLQVFIYVTGSAAAVLTPLAITAAMADPQTARRLWRGLMRHISGQPVTRPTITGRATGHQGGGDR